MKTESFEDTKSKNFLPLEETFLSDELLKKAELELNETEENRKKCLLDLKHLISCEKDLEANTEEKFLLRFLRARKFDTNRAFNLLKEYYSHREKYPDLHKDSKPSTVVNVLNQKGYGLLPYRNAAGCAICVEKWGLWDTNMFTIEELCRCSLASVNLISDNEITQICGIVTIVDLTNFSLNHLAHFSTRIINFGTSIQNCFPLRVKQVHIVNPPTIFSILFSLSKPFLSKKMIKRIIVHGSDVESLHQYLSPALLPEEFGGELGPFDNSRFTEMLLESEQNYIKNQSFGFKTNMKEQ